LVTYCLVKTTRSYSTPSIKYIIATRELLGVSAESLPIAQDKVIHQRKNLNFIYILFVCVPKITKIYSGVFLNTCNVLCRDVESFITSPTFTCCDVLPAYVMKQVHKQHVLSLCVATTLKMNLGQLTKRLNQRVWYLCSCQIPATACLCGSQSIKNLQNLSDLPRRSIGSSTTSCPRFPLVLELATPV
jgi:hypothetical protein